MNYKKSEAVFLGSPTTPTNLQSKCKLVDLKQDSIKILGIHFSNNNGLSQKLNIDKLFKSYKSKINIWKSRSLTLYGKNEVFKSLALSKILYVTSVLIPPTDFLEKVKNEMLKFIWSGRAHKVAYKVLISKKDAGGIGLPDVHLRVKTQQIILIK